MASQRVRAKRGPMTGSAKQSIHVVPGRAKREPGISRFPDAQLRI
jgi:hypothetical protein